MAALSDRLLDSIIPLRNIRPEQLGPVLEEEIAEWRPLHWDFRPSADLVRRFSGMQALDGFVLMAGPRIAGFSYSVAEEEKGLVGDLFVAPEFRTEEREHALLEAVLGGLWRIPNMRRIEAQLLMISHPLQRQVPYRSFFRSHERQFFEAALDRVTALPAHEPAAAAIVPWNESRQEEAARLIAHAYEDHVDSQINDQYRSAGGARRFLTNIVQYPGCGTFFAPASYVAIERATGSMCALCLSSLVAADAGHITQVCVAPGHRGTGLGYEILRRSLGALASHGSRTASLTVTSANTAAIQLYRRMGFSASRDFAAYVWERP